KLHMHSDCSDRRRASVAVIRRVGYFLEIKCKLEALQDLQVVIEFEDRFRAVAQSAVADDEVEPAGREVGLVRSRDAVEDVSQAHFVAGSPPARAFQQKAKGRRFVDGREGPGLGMPVAPAQARPEAKVASDLLLQVKEEAVLEAVRLRKRYVGRN